MTNPAGDLIDREIKKLKAFKESLETGVAEMSASIKERQKEIQTTANTIETLRADRKKLNGHAK